MARDTPAGWAISAFKAFCATVIVITTIFTLYRVGPVVETRYFPVVEKLIVDRIESRGDEGTRLWASFRKLRDCEYVGIAWYRGTRDDFDRVPIILRRVEGDLSSPNRPIGYQHAGPWDISVPIDELPVKSWAILYHKCHGFWVSRTEFYP